MRWQGRRESDNIEDRRYDEGGYNDGPGGGFPFPGGGGFQIPMGQGGIGGGGIIGLLVIVGIALLLGVDPRVILGGGAEAAAWRCLAADAKSRCRTRPSPGPPAPATTP